MLLNKINYKILSKNLTHIGSRKKDRSNYANNFIYITKTLDIIDTNHTFKQLQKIIPIFINIIVQKGQVYTIAPNLKNKEYALNLSKKYKQNFFCDSWPTGLITNFKYLKKTDTLIKKQIPSAIFLLNYPKTNYLELEILKIGVLTSQLLDTHTQINKTMYPIPGNTKAIQTMLFFIEIMKETTLLAYTKEQYILLKRKFPRLGSNQRPRT